MDLPNPGVRSIRPLAFQRKHHLMHGRRRHAEIPFHVGLRRRSAVDFCVVIDEREVLALFFRVGLRRWHRLIVREG